MVGVGGAHSSPAGLQVQVQLRTTKEVSMPLDSEEQDSSHQSVNGKLVTGIVKDHTQLLGPG